MYTRLDEILGWLHRRLTEVEKIVAVKGTISLSNLGELHAVMERICMKRQECKELIRKV
ncbi:MAG: hypothetical protein H9806_06340 [Candidatus Lactobacillus pullistercoris]|uniref:Uncharacterized protein n=1 Tax=Candidatus Lactobacillus pullistercoris TaxID=2838636 RepID=A0A9E2KRE5_9LACO|nr:hypothetical protein [Candidatus Lactobacillus pullistercoris]